MYIQCRVIVQNKPQCDQTEQRQQCKRHGYVWDFYKSSSCLVGEHPSNAADRIILAITTVNQTVGCCTAASSFGSGSWWSGVDISDVLEQSNCWVTHSHGFQSGVCRQWGWMSGGRWWHKQVLQDKSCFCSVIIGDSPPWRRSSIMLWGSVWFYPRPLEI